MDRSGPRPAHGRDRVPARCFLFGSLFGHANGGFRFGLAKGRGWRTSDYRPLGALTGRRMRAICRACADAKAINSDLLGRLQDSFLKVSLGVRIAVFLGIVLIMSAKPEFWAGGHRGNLWDSWSPHCLRYHSSLHPPRASDWVPRLQSPAKHPPKEYLTRRRQLSTRVLVVSAGRVLSCLQNPCC